MNRWLTVLAFTAGLGSLFSSAQVKRVRSPLDVHIENIRGHRVDPLTIRFARLCGVELKAIPAQYGFSNDESETWQVVTDLPKAYDNHVMHLIGTAELWTSENRTVIEEWKAILDAGSFSRTQYCFDADRKLQILDAANFKIPIDGTQRWGMHMRWARRPDGTFFTSEPFHFIGLDGGQVPAPMLTKDDRQIADHWSKRLPAPMTLDGLKLPTLLIGNSQVLSGPK